MDFRISQPSRYLKSQLIVFLSIIFSTSSVNAVEESDIMNDANKMFSEIQSHVPNIKSFDFEKHKNEIPGIYSTYGPTMLERLGRGTSGSLFYIFPDGTYLYTKWADIMPETIYEKGHWEINDSFITFIGDNSLSKERSTSEKYLPIRMENNNILIMGNKWDYHYFSTHYFDGDDPAFIMLVATHEKIKNISNVEIEPLKAELMERAWKPWFFAEGFPPHQLKVDAYNKSDLVAVVQTISGHMIPLEEGGGSRVKARIVSLIKGKSEGEVIDIFYGAVNIGQKYIANLIWDAELNGYKYYDLNMDIPVVELENYDQDAIERTMGAWGLTGKAISFENNYYLPDCNTKCDDICQRKFEYVQYMFSQRQ